LIIILKSSSEHDSKIHEITNTKINWLLFMVHGVVYLCAVLCQVLCIVLA